MTASARKTMQLDLLQLNSLNFLTSSNTPIPSSFVLYANGNGTTSFGSISSLTSIGFTDIIVPGQSTISASNTQNTLIFSSFTSEIEFSTSQISSIVLIGFPTFQSTLTGFVNQSQASTNFNFLTYPNITSSIGYLGKSGILGTTAVTPNVSYFSSAQYNFSTFRNYLNPNGSTRMFLEYIPNFTFAPVITPSSISSLTLYPEGNSSIKNLISLSSHMIYTNVLGAITPVIESGNQQYINVTSSYPYTYSSITNLRPLSNSFVQPIQFEMDTITVRSNFNFSLLHFISDGIGAIKTIGGNDVFKSGFERSNIFVANNTGDKNTVFINIVNSGNQY